jgi:hypothetical protein
VAYPPRPGPIHKLGIGREKGYILERQVRHAKENLYNRTNHQQAERSRSANQAVWCKYFIRGNSGGPGGTRVLDLFSAIDMDSL